MEQRKKDLKIKTKKMSKEKCKVCGAKGYHKLSCSNNVNRPKKLNVDIKPKQR